MTDKLYYAVIFTAQLTGGDVAGYTQMANRMEELARQQPGYLGIESARGADGLGLTVLYWESLEAIRAWRNQAEHLVAQRIGRERWYEWFKLRVCRVEDERQFEINEELTGQASGVSGD